MESKHTVTQEDLDKNPKFAATGAKVGDQVENDAIKKAQESNPDAESFDIARPDLKSE